MNEPRTPRVAIVADDSGPVHGVPWTLTQLRDYPLPGYTLDVVRSERSIDAWALRRPDLVHLGTGGGMTGAARAAARALGLRTIVSHHTSILPGELGQARLFLSPSAAADAFLLQRGLASSRIARWEPSVDREYFSPARYAPGTLPEGFSVLHAGPLTQEHGIALLADAWRIVHERNPRLRLVVAGDGPGRALLRHRLGPAVTLVGSIGPEHVAQLYATADLFVTASASDLFGQTILEAQASGLRSSRLTPERRRSSSRRDATDVSCRRRPQRSHKRSSGSPGAALSATGSSRVASSRRASTAPRAPGPSSRTPTPERSPRIGSSHRPVVRPRSRVPPEFAAVPRRGAARPMSERMLAVALHDVGPRSFTRVREIREWLSDRGVSRLTLLVIPAPDLHPIGARAPALAAWLRGRVACGDTVAQHGLVHQTARTAKLPRRVVAGWQGGTAAEFPGLAADDALRRVQTGRRLLNEIELDPRGFVAPGYAYTRALRQVLSGRYDWFAELRCVRTASSELRAPALCLGSSTPLKRTLSPALARAAGRVPGPVMRIDVHPADFDLPGHVATLEALLERAAGRDVVTYDELID